MIAYRVDIDGTIGEPMFQRPHFQDTASLYVEAGLLTKEDVSALNCENHQRLWLLPQILVTHIPLPDAVHGVEMLMRGGGSLRYFTVRQALERNICDQVHENTRCWLEQQGFPQARSVEFFWDVGEKLTKALEASEDRIALIDDRVSGLLNAYQNLRETNAAQAEEIQKRVILVAFGPGAREDLPRVEKAPEMFFLEDWSRVSDLLSFLVQNHVTSLEKDEGCARA